ncbi:dipeptidyl peptidase iv : Gll3871 protein OS=Gloeobacter violaceus (strain PCC 7421) GN=gll3871 PE=4 SV=1: DPPIV_N: Peptidase_S9 [Gemmata massiliana]|uniref:Peptidase S9 prolyl oligopeptidase catalytic domain-containing protein n=2 Tax=Gemmata massiliana TaxID=1210884 RepID=A0A6P2DL12_9BACT|nr:dipeptidyl peptidase iv : Gll3871 protein OS=Gloeobacter violaceus (strain PCC 7421) GN=gll3871 PE=4 SV=1: DPPIV_N: Peptidase_S9 [Gemmata massiliana]
MAHRDILSAMKTTLALTLTLSCAALAHAAEPTPNKAVDTSFLKKFAETRRFMLGRPQNPKIAPDGKTVLFLRAEVDKPTLKLFEFDVATARAKEILSPESLLKGGAENLTPEEKARRERMRLSAGGFADFHFDKDGTNILLPLSGKLFVYERATGNTTQLKTGEGGSIVDPKWSPDGKKVAYVRGFDVFVCDLATNTETAVTKGGTTIKTHGLAEFVAQEEMARFTGYWWAPDGKHIAYEEADHTGVETWFVADPFKPDAKPAEQFYPRPGKKNVSVRLGVVPVEGGETVWLDWDHKTYDYLTAVRWDESAPLTLQVQDRKQQKLLLLAADPKTGKTKKLLEEKDAAWINLTPETPKFNSALGGFVWLGADTDGESEIQHRNADGVLNNVLVPAKRRPEAVMSVYSSRVDTFVIYAGSTDPTQRHIYRHKTPSLLVNPESDKDTALTTEPGTHTAVFGKFGGPYVITSTTTSAMPKSFVFGRDGAKLGELPSVASEPEIKPDVTVLRVGEEPGYYAAIVRPKGFDPKKKYPVIVDVYGGPKHLHVVQAMRNWLVPQWLADQGFIVVAVDNRGTPGRGREWERSLYQKFGTVPLEDQVKGLNLLCAKFPELDKDRVGIVGWSFGGYMAANGVLRAPEVFKAAVAGAPVTDWEDYDTHYTERYMGLLPESRKQYDDASLLPLAKDLKRPLLLVHGTADDNVYYRHTLKLSNALFRAGRDFESLPLPGVTHMYTSDPVVMERLWAKTATFFKTHLGEPK